ncbi:MAG TPA: hypothetical protein VFU29_09195 [Chitinophagaceae bacterium]|nr:hypothetical protein [Chitinophagaceae bacterium]
MKLLKNKSGLILLKLLLAVIICDAQDSTNGKKELQLNVTYYLPQNNVPYLLVTTKTKVERKFVGVKDLKVNVYLNSTSDSNLIQSFQSNATGEERIYIPPSFKGVWDASPSFRFIAVAAANQEFDETKSEVQVNKAKIQIDTSRTDETKNVTVYVKVLQNGEWIPAKNVELKIAVKRSIGNLPIGDEETYTTDSTGSVTAEFKRDSLLGDSKGNFILVARTEDNETLGNIFAEKNVTWGIAPTIDNSFYNRSLWATSSKTPVWLLFMAYSIVIGVWGTIIYLVSQLFKIKKLGKIS